MRKKAFLIFSLSLLLLHQAIVQDVKGTWYIKGWIGRYVSIDHIAIDPWTSEFKVNETAYFEIFLQNWETVFVKTINITITVADTKYSETLAKDYNWIKPPNALAGAIHKLVKLTPQKPGLVSLYIYADYQYNEGNQTIEQEGSFELINVANVSARTYSDVSSENAVLHVQIYDLNSTLQVLNAAYANIEKWTYLLGFTNIALIGAIILVVIVYKRRELKQSS
jgi:hypothetical protein